MPQLIEGLAISGYRGFADLFASGFGRVNLITGRNNSGKSTLLECIRLLVTGGSPYTIRDILDYRDETLASLDSDRVLAAPPLAPMGTLFFGCPELGAQGANFEISAEGGLPHSLRSLKVRIGWYTRNVDTARQTVSYEPADGDLFDEVESFLALDMEVSGRKRVIPLDRFGRRVQPRLDLDAPSVPCIYLDPFSSRSTSQMGALWDAIALTEAEHQIVRALKVVSRDIEAVSMIGNEDRGRGRTAIAKSRLFASPVPLRTFGDGVNRLFGIVLSLCSARGGILLVDEIENGLHYSVQSDVWASIFQLARSLNVQVFATTHSWDCVKAFQEAASKSPDDGVLMRITKRGNDIATTVFNEEELAIVSRDQIEVR